MAPTRVAIKEEFGERPDSYRDVEPLLNQIDDTVDEQEARGDAGKRGEELDHNGQHIHPAEHDRRGHGEFASGILMLPRQTQFSSFELGNNATDRIRDSDGRAP